MSNYFLKVYKHSYEVKNAQLVLFTPLFSPFFVQAWNSPVQSRNTPVAMITPHTASLHIENAFCILTHSLTLMQLMKVSRPGGNKIQDSIK
jgi:hypothetical protein